MRKLCLCTLALIFLLVPAVGVAEKPLVRVGFTLAEPVYRDELTASQIRDLGTGVTSFLIAALSREVRFLRFVSGDAPFRLVVRLGKPGASRGAHHDVVFDIELTGPNGVGSGTTWPFRGSDAWGIGIGSALQFSTEIQTSLDDHDMADLVPKVLSAITVATAGLLVPNDVDRLGLGWVVPLHREDVCMDMETEIELWTLTERTGYREMVPGKFLARATMTYDRVDRVVPEEFRRGLLCIANPNQQGLEVVEMSQPKDVHVVKVFVKSYHRNCEELVLPAAAAASFKGGR